MLNVCWGLMELFTRGQAITVMYTLDYIVLMLRALLSIPMLLAVNQNACWLRSRASLPAERATSTNSMVPTELQPR